MEFSRRAALTGSIVALMAAQSSYAQSYPAGNIRLIVPQGAGGLADVLGRFLAKGLSESSRQNVFVENRPGAGTVIGSDVVVKAPPDGYTLLLATVSLSILPAIDDSLPFDPAKDLAPVTLIADVPSVLLVHKSVPADTLEDFVAYAKKNPGKLSYASQGVGTTGHMAGELLKQAAGIDIAHVPYRGGGPAAQDLLAGHVHMLFDALPLAVTNLQNDSVKALAVTSAERVKALPTVPTTSEAGLPAVQSSAWFGLFAPSKTPETVIQWLHEATTKTFNDPSVRGKLVDQGTLLPLLGPAELRAYMAKDTKRWTDVARAGNIRNK